MASKPYGWDKMSPAERARWQARKFAAMSRAPLKSQDDSDAWNERENRIASARNAVKLHFIANKLAAEEAAAKPRPPVKTSGGGPIAFMGDLGRSAVSLADLAAMMGMEMVNMVPQGMAGIEATTPLGRNLFGRAMRPAQDDVAGLMADAPQIDNPFPMTEGGQSRIRSIGDAITAALGSPAGKKLQEIESDIERVANEYLSPEVAGTIYATTLAAVDMATPGEVPKSKLFSSTKPKLSKVDKSRLAALVEKYPDIKPMLKYMTVEERKALKWQHVNNLINSWNKLDPSEMASVALAGQAKRGWYKESSKALVELFGDDDAPRFAALLAAMSPQTSVESNLRNALHTWLNWDRAGRPTDAQSIMRIMGESVEGEKGIDSVLGAWAQNSVDALSAADVSELVLSGAKVDSFMRNIWGNFAEVTNDAWIAKYTGLDQGTFSSSRTVDKAGFSHPGKKTGVYLGINSATRKAAELLTRRTGEKWTPAEVQETIWSWSKSISERATATQTPITELIHKLTHAEVADTPDFGTLLSRPGEFRNILVQGGVDEQALQRLETFAGRDRGPSVDPSGASASDTGIQPRHLDAAARRLEGARRGERRPKAYEDLRASVERSIAGEAAPAFSRRDSGNRRGHVATTYSLPAARVRLFNSLGHSTPPVHELRRTAQTGTRFHKAITSAAEAHPAGAQVYVYSPDEYANMRLFLTEDGKAGFALNGDDIVSVFNHRKSNYQGVTAELLALAVEQGGRRLDAFDTYLPHLYERFGFQIVRREPWNEKRKPKGWDKEHFRKYNHGEPDVVFMEYRPTKKVVDEMAKKNRVLDLNQQPQPVPISENIDLSRFDDRLRQTLG